MTVVLAAVDADSERLFGSYELCTSPPADSSRARTASAPKHWLFVGQYDR